MMFHGSIPALVTPFNDHEIDVPAFEELIEWQITSGSSALVPTGTTGESPTLSHAEHKRVVEICIKQAAGRVPVIAGAGSNNTAEAIELSIHAEKAGADAVLIVMPYYNKPNQEGLIHHFKAIDQKIGIPIIIYNIPGRSIADMLPETMAKLYHDCRNIVGVKDATANMARASMQRQLCGTDFVQLSGEDITALGFCAHGGHGCISVTANVAPSICAEMQAACAAKDYASALLIQDRLAPLHRALFIEPSPQGVKYALSLLGKVKNELRLPMVPVIPETEDEIRAAMIHAGLLN